MKKGKILVTGGLGYIGSHTVVELQLAGYHVVVVDNLSNSQPEVKERIESITGKTVSFYNEDVTDFDGMSRVFKKNKNIVAVIHFAAFKAVGESVEKPLDYYYNNVGGMMTLLDVMEEFGCSEIVFSSSCTVYGQPEELPVTENSPINKAMSPYGSTKIMCEQILEDVCHTPLLRAISLRYFNPVGAHESGLIGELPKGIPNNLVPFITQSAAGIRGPITIHGTDYDTPDGTCIRDYIHVTDLALAHVAALDYLLQETFSYDVFNIGTGTGYSVLEVIKAFESVTGKPLQYHIGPRRAGDVTQVWANTEKANRLLGWKTERNLQDMMQTSWKWQQSLDGYMMP
jgi:UDP-glucose 4-epimerase